MRVLLMVLLAALALVPAAAGAVVPDSAAASPRAAAAARFVDPLSGSPSRAAEPGPLPASASGADSDAYGILSRSRLPAAQSLYDVAVARFDADASPDMVVSGLSDGLPALVFMWNDGAGGFPASSAFALAANARGIAVADLDGDGDPDLVVSTQGPAGGLVAIENLGGRVIRQHAVPGAIENAPLRPAISDVTGDGVADIVIACYDGDSLWLARGLGGFAFAAPVGVPAARYAVQCAAGDVDGDGRGEAFVAYEDCNSVSLFRGGAGGLVYADEIGFRWGALGIALGDLAGGTAPDLVAGTSHGTFTVLENIAGAFPSWTDHASVAEPIELVAADLDGDGQDEVLGAGFSTDAVSVLSRAGGAGFESRAWGAGIEPAAVATGDLDGDGRGDVVTAERWGATVNLLWGDGGTSLRASREFGTGGRPVNATLADLDGDARLDVVTVHDGVEYGGMSILMGLAGGGLGPAVTRPTPRLPYSVAAGDLTGDGFPELVTANHGAGGISVFVNDGSGAFPARTDVPTADRPYDVAIGDLDGDGRRDVVVAHYGAGTLSVLRGTGGGALAPWQSLPAATGPTGVLLADLDADGDLDVAAACYQSNTIRLYRNDGGGGLAQVAAVYCPGGPWRMATTTRPGRSYPLLLVACRKASYVTVFAAEAPFGFGSAATVTVGANPSSVLALDLDGDGLSELVTSDYNAASLSVARGIGSTFGAVTSYPACGWPQAVMAGDLTGDGTPDLVVANMHSGTVSVFTRRVPTTPDVGVPGTIDLAWTQLEAPYPNPARSVSRIAFSIARTGQARVAIVDLGGRRVRVLADGAFVAGRHVLGWDGRDDHARELPAGMYFCVLEAGERRESRRLMWLR